MKIRIQSFAFVFMFLVGLLGSPLLLHAQTSYNLTVKSGPLRHSFEGFGTGSTTSWPNWDPTLREQMADLVYRDLKANVIRLWTPVTTGTGANPPLMSVADMVSVFNTSFVASGYLDGLRNRGVSTFLLAPGPMQPPASLSDYANNLAELILQVKNSYNVEIGMTGVSNEPGPWTPAQLTQCVIYLRSALDSRGLTDVKIIAPESSASVDGCSGMLQIDAMLASGTAWDCIYGIASHNYTPMHDHECENRKFGKPWWITEAAGAGSPYPEWAEDENFASWVLEIFLSNVNHGVSEWIHLNGFKQVGDFYNKPGDPSMLVMGDLKTRTVIPYLQYYYFKQALSVLDTGAIFRKCFSPTEGDMFPIAGGQNPAINAAAAYNPDGSWGINIINLTGVSGTTATSTNRFYAETTYNVNLTVEELANTPSVDFTIFRSRANNHVVQSETVTFVNGVGTVSIAPRELVSLRSGSTALAIPPTPNGLTYATINDHLGLTWNNTVNATSWNVKRAMTSGGPYTTIATTTNTTYDDESAANGTHYYYVVSAVNSLGESANSSEVFATPAPFPWTNTDIGNVGVTGSCSVTDSGTFTIWGAGANITSTADSFNYTYVPMSGSGSIIARIACKREANVKIGIAMQETLSVSPKASYLIYNFGSANQVQMANRTVAGSYGPCITSTMTGTPMWLKLNRSGNTFTGYASTDGTSWTTIGSGAISMSNNIFAGIAVCPIRTTSTTRAYFDNVSAPALAPTEVKQLSAASGQIGIGWTASYGATSYNIKRATVSGGPYTTIGSVNSPALNYTDTTAATGTPYYYVVSAVNAMGESANSTELSTWYNVDIGTVGLSGSLVFSNGIFTTTGAGVGLGGTTDSFNFTCKAVTGDCTLIARVASVTNPQMGKVGILMQETLGTSPKMACTFYDCHYQYVQSRTCFRTTAGAYGSWASSGVTGLPSWLKLVRSGTTFTGYASTDGTTWTTISSRTISMGSTIYVGLVDMSRNTSQLTTATFDNVTLTTP